MALKQPRQGIDWRSLGGYLTGAAQGFFVLLLGPAKSGKTATAASVYTVFKPDEVFWISAGELDGWRTAERIAGSPIRGIDLDQLEHPEEVFQLVQSLADGHHKAIVLDSFDGAGRWCQDFLCGVNPGARSDSKSKLQRLDKGGYGLLLTFTKKLWEYLHGVAKAGTHVIATSGVEARSVGDQEYWSPVLPGKGGTLLARAFSDVGLVQREGNGARTLIFDGQSRCRDAGSRSGFPASLRAEDFGSMLLKFASQDSGEGEEPGVDQGQLAGQQAEAIARPGLVSVGGDEAGKGAGTPAPKQSPPAEAESAQPPAEQPETLNTRTDPDEVYEERRKSVTKVFLAYDVPLKFQDDLAQLLGARSWEGWQPNEGEAVYGREFIGVFGTALYYTQNEQLSVEVALSVPRDVEAGLAQELRDHLPRLIEQHKETRGEISMKTVGDLAKHEIQELCSVPF